MDIYKREIERKFVLKGVTYGHAFVWLANRTSMTANSESFDQYWKGTGVDFIRLRENSHEITVKVTDKGTVVDRIEENVEVSPEAMEDARRALTLMFGPSCLTLTKRYSVFDAEIIPAPDTKFKAIICLYEVENDPEQRVFFEIEAESLTIVDEFVQRMPKDFTLTTETRSLFQIFYENTK